MLHKLINRIENCQLKFDSDEKGTFSGYASAYHSVDSVGDTIEPGAFKQSLESGRAIKLYVNHRQHEVPVGDWVELKEDDYGLRAVGRIDMNHKDGMTVYSALLRKAMDGLSIGFTASTGDYTLKDENDPYGGRLYKNLNLMEISIVSFPCEGLARIGAVKQQDLDLLQSLKDCERYLRDAGGMSKSAAAALVSRIRDVCRSDSEKALQDEIARQHAEVSGAVRDVFASIRKLTQ